MGCKTQHNFVHNGNSVFKNKCLQSYGMFDNVIKFTVVLIVYDIALDSSLLPYLVSGSSILYLPSDF